MIGLPGAAGALPEELAAPARMDSRLANISGSSYALPAMAVTKGRPKLCLWVIMLAKQSARNVMPRHITDNANFREPIDKESVLAELAPGDKVLSFALHPNKAKAALYLNNGGKHRVVIYNFETGKIKSTPIEGGFATEQ